MYIPDDFVWLTEPEGVYCSNCEEWWPNNDETIHCNDCNIAGCPECITWFEDRIKICDDCRELRKK